MTTVAPDVRSETIKALAATVFAARRVVPVVGTPLHPTSWDNYHATLDALLDDLRDVSAPA